MKEEKREEGGRSAMRLCTKLKIQNFPMLDALLKINGGIVSYELLFHCRMLLDMAYG